MRYLIVGNCAAGINAVEGIRKLDKSGEINVISDEDFPAYCRCLITDYVAGLRKKEDILYREKDFYDKYKVNLILGERVREIDVTREPGYMYPEIAKREGIVSMLSVPMMIKERVIGVINSYTSYEHKFTDEEVKILQAIANQAAVAIESTNLTQELIATKQALETRKLVERAKGLLMKELSLSEDEAYKLINKKAMDTRKTMREVAEAIILFMEMRKGS